MKNLFMIVTIIIILPLNAQNINGKLGGNTESETFDITDSDDNILFRILGNGNVGIGTTTPDEKFHIAGNMRLNGTFEDKDGEAGTAGQILSSTATGTDWIAASSGVGDNLGNHTATQNLKLNNKWLSNTGNNMGLFVNYAGWVGLGTSDPHAQFAIYDSAGSYIQIQNFQTGKNYDDGLLIGLYNDGTSAEIKNYEDSPIYFGTNNLTRMTIAANGNVGIGTTTPSEALEVDGNIAVSGTVDGIDISTDVSANTAKVTDDDDGVAEVYGAGWDSDNDSPTKNDIYDKIEALPGGHDAVTIGTANGLSLSTQQISLSTATTGAAGAMSAADKTKLDGLSSGGNTLDQAYDQGGVGAGRTIIADAGAFNVGGVDGVLFTGTWNTGTIPVEGAGTRMMWYSKKGAFRAGRVDADQWNDSKIGNYSFATGWATTAIGGASTALGNTTVASGSASVAMGYLTIASGDYSTAIGREIEANSDYSVAIALNDQNGTTVTQANTMAIMGGKVGIGTTTPAYKLSVIAPVPDNAIYAEVIAPGDAVAGFASTSAVPNMISYGGNFTSAADLGRGVYGYASHVTGINYGVKGKTNSSKGYAGYFEGRGYFSGNVGIGTDSPHSKLSIVGLNEYTNNAAALAAGLSAGDLYRTGDLLKIVH